MRTKLILALFLAAAASISSAASAASAAPATAPAGGRDGPVIVVTRRPAVVVRKTFDPKNKPREMPELKAGEDALCSTWFGIDVSVRGRTEAPPVELGGGRVSVPVRITRVEATLTLTITLWLPEGAPAALVAHEEGHQRLAERFYATAEEAARRVAEQVARGGAIVGAGTSSRAALDQALNRAVDRVTSDYGKVVHEPAQRAHEIYDRLTDHGRRRDVAEDDAIRRAIDQVMRADADGKTP